MSLQILLAWCKSYWERSTSVICILPEGQVFSFKAIKYTLHKRKRESWRIETGSHSFLVAELWCEFLEREELRPRIYNQSAMHLGVSGVLPAIRLRAAIRLSVLCVCLTWKTKILLKIFMHYLCQSVIFKTLKHAFHINVEWANVNIFFNAWIREPEREIQKRMRIYRQWKNNFVIWFLYQMYSWFPTEKRSFLKTENIWPLLGQNLHFNISLHRT